jgi:hypothetical protein
MKSYLPLFLLLSLPVLSIDATATQTVSYTVTDVSSPAEIITFYPSGIFIIDSAFPVERTIAEGTYIETGETLTMDLPPSDGNLLGQIFSPGFGITSTSGTGGGTGLLASVTDGGQQAVLTSPDASTTDVTDTSGDGSGGGRSYDPFGFLFSQVSNVQSSGGGGSSGGSSNPTDGGSPSGPPPGGDTAAVPEPSTWILFVGSLLGFLTFQRMRFGRR